MTARPCIIFYTCSSLHYIVNLKRLDRKHATGSKGMLLSHNNCIPHKQAVVAWSISAVKIIQTHLKNSDD